MRENGQGGCEIPPARKNRVFRIVWLLRGTDGNFGFADNMNARQSNVT